MNATIQEIEGIDDYWGPAFRSVYEGEGHEAFVQQLDERIVQHDKEIEKLCNFHYQPKKKTQRRRRPLEPMESANYYTEYHHGNKITEKDNYKASSGSKSRGCNTPPHRHFFSDDVLACYDDNERPSPKRRRLDLRRLGGYSDTFPNAGSKKNNDFEPHNTRSLDSLNGLEQDDDQENEYDDLAELSCREYDEITKYHTMAMQQKNQEPRGECHVNSSDLRLYLRNRNERDASVEHRDQRLKQYEEEKVSERRRGHIRGTSAELPRDWCEPSNRSSSYHNGDSQTSSKKHRSRREAFDDQNRDNRYEFNSRRGQRRYDSIELRHSKSRHENSHHEECRKVHGQNSSRELSLSKSRSNSGTSRSVYVEYQPSKSDRPTPLEKESDLNTSSDLRCYLRSKSKDDNVATVTSSDPYHPELITHFRRLSRASSNGSNSRVEREANHGNTVYDSNPKEHYRSGQAYENANSSFESHHAERFVGHPSAEHHQSSHEPAKRHYEKRRHLSPRRDASSKAQNGYPLSLDHNCDPNSFVTTEQSYQSRPLPAGLYYEKTRSLSAEQLHHRQSRELSTEHRQSQVVSAELHQSQTRAVPTEISHEDHPVPAQLHHSQRSASSAENHYNQSRDLSNDHYSGKNHYLSTTGDRHYNSRITSELGSSRETPERYRNTRHMSMEHHYNESCYTSSERYSRENHLGQDCGEIRQTLSDRHCDNRQFSAEHHRDVRVNTSADCQRNGDSYHNSFEPYREKRRHTSSGRQNRVDDSNAVATPKDNTNRLVSNLDLAENSMPIKDLPKKSLPVYSRRHPGQSDNVSESLLKNHAKDESLRNSLKTAVKSGQETVTSDLNVTARSQFSKEYQLLPSDIPVCEPRLKEIQPDLAELREKESQREPTIRQYISVRAVEAINNSALIAEPIGESSCVAASTVSFPKSANESNCNNPNAVMSRDPRVQPRHPDSPIELDINSLSTAECAPLIIESEKNTNLLNSRINRDPRLRPRQGTTSLNTIQEETSNQTVQEATTDILTEVAGLPNFNPSNKTQDINKWIGRINEIAVTCNWTDQQVVDFAITKLAGNAKRWYQGFTSSSDLSWSEWREKLKAAFPFSENYGKMLSDMLNKTAKTGDSLEEYYLEKITMLNRCGIRGKRAIECIIFGIEDEVVRTKAEAENFSDPDELLGCLRSLKNRRVDSEL